MQKPSSKTVSLVLGVILILLVGRLFLSTSPRATDPGIEIPMGVAQSPEAETTAVVGALSAALPDSTEPLPPAESATGATAQNATEDSLPLIKIAPTLADFRREAQANPHSTPQTLLGFAEKVAKRKRAALDDPSKMPAFLKDVTECKASAELEVVRKYCADLLKDLPQDPH